MALPLVTRTTAEISKPTAAWRETARGLRDHAALFADAACLHEVEVGLPSEGPGAGPPKRVLAWNAERLKFLDASAACLLPLAADVILITEIDCGMARSGNRHTLRELAQHLGMGYVLGVEFVELGLGDARERGWHAGEVNTHGLHGAGILSRLPIEAPALLRLDADGTWLDGSRNGEQRVGGRIAMLATIGGIVMASVHLESHSDPEHRAGQMSLIYDTIEALAPGGPAIIGGDLNTKSVSRDDWLDEERRRQALEADPNRRMHPIVHEPLFEAARRMGYGWKHANDGLPSERLRPGDPPADLGRIDWFLTRGVGIAQARTVPAVDAGGVAISDHEILLLDLE